MDLYWLYTLINYPMALALCTLASTNGQISAGSDFTHTTLVTPHCIDSHSFTSHYTPCHPVHLHRSGGDETTTDKESVHGIMTDTTIDMKIATRMTGKVRI